MREVRWRHKSQGGWHHTFNNTTPRTGSFSRILESLTVTVTCDLRQSRMNLSVPALNIGELVIGFTRVSYTSSSFSDLETHQLMTKPMVPVSSHCAVAGWEAFTLLACLVRVILAFVLCSHT